MKIDQEINLKTGLESEHTGLKELEVKIKNFHQLSPGDIFKATITNIQPNQVSIRLLSGGELTAKSLMLPDARIGDDTLFTVKENNKGQILLEMIKPEADVLKENIAREALISANIYPSEENIKLVKTLMDNNLPIDANSLQKAVFFHYSAVSMPMEKIMFLMKENFPMDAVNIDILEKLTESGGFTQKLMETAEGVLRLDGNLQAQILEKLIPAFEESAPEFAAKIKAALSSVKKGEKADIKGLAQKIAQNLSLILDDKKSLDKLESYFRELHKSISETEKLLAGNKDPLSERMGDLRRQLEFMDHIGNYKEYMQIPLFVNGRLNNAELFIFKEPRRKKNLKEQASVLIAMDYANLGRVEVFIDKADKNLSFQFRSDRPESLKLLNTHFTELNQALASLGYKISGLTFKNIDESFTVLDSMETKESKAVEKKRYSFDMRV